MAKPYDLDQDLRNADWLRSRTWDLRARGGGLVTTLDQLREHFAGDDRRLAHFMTLPAAEPMPLGLRAAVEGHLFGGATMKMRVVKSDELERLAALEHEQWESWTRSLAERGDVPGGLAAHWRTLWKPYGALTEAEKEKDREWARRALAIVKADEPALIALSARDRIDEEIQKYSDDQPRDEQGRWTAGGGVFDPKAPAVSRPSPGTIVENPGFRPALARVAAKVAASNVGRRLRDAQGNYTIPAPGDDGRPWSEAKLRDEIAKAEEIVRTRPSTLETWGSLTPEQRDARVEARKGWVREEYGQGAKPAPGQAPRADIWMGPAGAGKSTMEDKFLAAGNRAVRIDADRFKGKMPEYDNGVGANAVHEESSNLANRLMDRARTHGDNISMSVVGKSYSNADPHDPGLLERVQSLKAQGYDVHLHLVNAKPETSLENTTRRFVEQGRYISGSYVYNGVDSKPLGSYRRLTSENGGLFASTEAINNDDRGSPRTYHPERGEEIP